MALAKPNKRFLLNAIKRSIPPPPSKPNWSGKLIVYFPTLCTFTLLAIKLATTPTGRILPLPFSSSSSHFFPFFFFREKSFLFFSIRTGKWGSAPKLTPRRFFNRGISRSNGALFLGVPFHPHVHTLSSYHGRGHLHSGNRRMGFLGEEKESFWKALFHLVMGADVSGLKGLGRNLNTFAAVSGATLRRAVSFSISNEIGIKKLQ
ncbi:hypothetical protein CDAR_49001 [Caerostris darwini]|uniref:Uncharacterized protein n=1 Tax=Caerostris darwini TaxID=1538125 RepID=A0AAV4NLE2_9ARAC|nr:hypothetical protein CDAR_49001 [Caerostris darwini]